jgi:polyhydroxybutyrate depolymerase
MRRGITTGLGLTALLVFSSVLAVPTAHAAGGPKARPSPGCKEGWSAAGPRRAGETVHTIAVDGETRSYRLAVPKNVRARGPVPLVLLVHGFSSNADTFSSLTRLPARGAADGFLVATPDGADGRWQLDAHGSDAAFLDAVVDELTSTYCVDLRNVHAAGMSLGSAFGLLYSCARQDEIASFVAVTVEFQLGCSTPMSILAFHGTEDPLVPYQDGKIGASLPGPVRGTELNMADWAELGGCRPEPRTRRIGSEVVRSAWSGCRGSTDVVLYTVEGGGHTWPGADPDRQVTRTTDQVDATAAGLAFFRRHPLP